MTGIRFFAAIHVVLYHNLYLFGDLSNQIPSFVRRIVDHGEAAVSLFFLLSGFILVHIYKDKLKSSKERTKYFLARFAKIYPLYFLAFLLDIPRVWKYFSSIDDSNAILKMGGGVFGYLSMLQSWHPRLTPVVNPPGWSLSCEMFFYICLPFLIGYLVKIKKIKTLILILYICPIVLYFFVTALYPDLENIPAFNTFWRSFPLIRIFEFLIGALLYFIVSRESIFERFVYRNRSFLFWGSIILSLLICSIDLPIPPKVFDGILLAPFFSIMILTSFYDDIVGCQFFRNRTVELLGLSSYALYIIHQPIKPYLLTLGGAWTYLIVLIATSIILFKWFELPLQTKIKKTFSKD